MNEVNWTQIVTAAVAVYGAVMSTITYRTNKKEKTRTLKVSFSNGILTYHNGTTSDAMLFINVANTGHKKAVVSIPRIILPDGSSVVFPNYQSNVQFPCNLEEGNSCMIWIDLRELSYTLLKKGHTGKIKLYADVSDATDKKHKSKDSYMLDINEWTKQ